MLDILKKITEYEMAICDLSSLNPNVMYELGIRQMAKKPVTLIKDKITKRIFDISSISDIEYDSSLRIDLVRIARTNITASLKETYEDRNSDPNSLLSLLGMQVQISKEKVEVTQFEKLMMDKLGSLSAQVSNLSSSVHNVNPRTPQTRTILDINLNELAAGMVVQDQIDNAIYFIQRLTSSYTPQTDSYQAVATVLDLNTNTAKKISFTSRATTWKKMNSREIDRLSQEQLNNYTHRHDL